MPITDEQKKAAKEQHPAAELITHPDGEQIIARPPTEAEWNIFRGMQSSDDQTEKVRAARMLVNTCMVVPLAKSDEGKAMLAAHPGYAEVFAGEIAEMAGIRKGASRAKL